MGTMHFSSSEFIISQSSAEFKSGVNADVMDINDIINGTFVGDGSNLTGLDGVRGIQMYVGSASGNPPTFSEWITGSAGQYNVRIEASSSGGHLNHYTFIEERGDGWKVVSSGSNGGIEEKNFYITKRFPTGIYRYLVLGHSSASKVTIVKPTTVTINPELI